MSEAHSSKLIQAAANGDDAAAQRAIADGENVNCTSDLDIHEKVTPLMFAVRCGHYSMVQYLLSVGADVRRRTRAMIPGEVSGETALHWAVREGHAKIAELLIKRGADLNVESTRGSVLEYAIAQKNFRLIKRLVEAGCDITKPRGKDRYTPILVAAENGDTKCIRLLHLKGAKLVPHILTRETPLMRACLCEQPLAAGLLITLGDHTNAKDKKGWTALMYSVWAGNEACVKVLLRKRVNVKARNNDGQTAWDLAQACRFPAGAYLIEKVGGRPRVPHNPSDLLFSSWAEDYPFLAKVAHCERRSRAN